MINKVLTTVLSWISGLLFYGFVLIIVVVVIVVLGLGLEMYLNPFAKRTVAGNLRLKKVVLGENVFNPLMKKNYINVLVYGDSWTYGNGYGLQHQVSKHKLGNRVRIITKDYWGSEASEFAKDTSKITNSIKKENADYLVLSLGGNDLKNLIWKNKLKGKLLQLPSSHYTAISEDLKIILDAIFTCKPELKVVVYGYDIPGDLSGVAQRIGTSYPIVTKGYDLVGTRLINYFWLKISHVYEDLAKHYSGLGYNMTYIPLWGSLQQEYDEKEEEEEEALEKGGKQTVPYTLGTPSLTKYMNDPAHPNHEGFKILMSRLWRYYFVPELQGLGIITKKEAKTEIETRRKTRSQSTLFFLMKITIY